MSNDFDFKEFIDRIKVCLEIMQEVKDHGEELVLIVPSWLYIRYSPKTWEKVEGVCSVEYDETLEEGFILMSRSEYLRVTINKLKESDYK